MKTCESLAMISMGLSALFLESAKQESAGRPHRGHASVVR